MAIGGMNGGGRNGRGRYRPMAEINVTPLVDVMLVLLIIFMVTAPLMTSGVNVDLPKTNAAPLNSDATPITVTINAQGDIFLADDAVDLSNLVARLQASSENNPDRRIFVRGDKDLSYGRIMQVMATITQGGFSKVALLAEQTADGAAAPAAPASGGAAAGAPAPGTPSTGTPSTGTPSTGTPSTGTPSTGAPRAAAPGPRAR